MAFTFPLTSAVFFDTLRAAQVRFHLGRQVQVTGLGGGEILSAEVAPPLWEGEVSLPAMKARDADAIAAILEALEQPGRTFEAYRVNRIGPRSDPLGAALSGASVEIAALDLPTARASLRGLPPGYQLSPGDLLSFAYVNGAAPRRALHRVSAAAVAGGDGATGLFQVTPHIRPGAQVGAQVSLVRPHCLAVLVPGSVSYGITQGSNTSGMGFQFRQTLRG